MNCYGFTGRYDFSKIGRIAFTKKYIQWEKVRKRSGWRHKMGVGNIFLGKNFTKNYLNISFIKKYRYQYKNSYLQILK